MNDFVTSNLEAIAQKKSYTFNEMLLAATPRQRNAVNKWFKSNPERENLFFAGVEVVKWASMSRFGKSHNPIAAALENQRLDRVQKILSSKKKPTFGSVAAEQVAADVSVSGAMTR
jgi:hypothetical protein